MILASLAFLVLALDGQITTAEGAALFLLLLLYLVAVIRLARRESPDVIREYEAEFGARPAGRRAWLINGMLVLVGLAMLVVGARWLVEGAVDLALGLGVSELVIGLTVVAIGTSLPELVTSIVAALRGERDLAVGNIVGSNIFNILSVLALTAFVAPGGVAVSPAALGLDIPFMVAVSVACLPIFFTGHVISRWEGGLFLLYGVGYTGYLVLDATRHEVLPIFSAVSLLLIVPLTVITLGIIVVRELNQRRGLRNRRT
jgi:cation:H+ antiporter